MLLTRASPFALSTIIDVCMKLSCFPERRLRIVGVVPQLVDTALILQSDGSVSSDLQGECTNNNCCASQDSIPGNCWRAILASGS